MRCLGFLAMATLGSSCASTLYVAARCTKENKHKVVPVYNATWRDLEILREFWTNWPGDDYIFPPWLDSSLNIGCGILDIPISLVFDTVTLPFQGIDYVIRRDEITKARESGNSQKAHLTAHPPAREEENGQ